MGITGLVWYRGHSMHDFSSARDQINHQTVAVKKLSEPFKTDNIAKHMYQEVTLLKQLQQDNVGRPVIYMSQIILTSL